MIVNKLTDKQKEQLLQVIPSNDQFIDYRPCQVTLKTGNIITNVYIQEEQSYLKVWGVMPDLDSNKKYILIEDIEEIKESPNRLRPDLATKLYKAGESGMGYCIFKLVFDNGQTLDIATGNAVDFVPIPNGLTTKNFKDVLPHQGSRQNFAKGLNYSWCLYKDDIS
jgi:hypothetical protein